MCVRPLSPSPRYPTSRGSCQLRSLPCSLAANVERSWEHDAGRGWRRAAVESAKQRHHGRDPPVNVLP